MVNNFWSPVAFYAVSEIERVGGPAADDDWDRRDGEPCLPVGAVQWILKSPDFHIVGNDDGPSATVQGLAHVSDPWAECRSPQFRY